MTRRVHVGVDASVLGWGSSGTERYVRNVVTRLPSDELDVTLFVNEHQPLPGLPGCRQVARRVRGAIPWRQVVVAPALAAGRFDAYWAPWERLPWRVPCPVAVTFHDLAPLTLPGTKPWLSTLLFRVAAERAARRADIIFANSAATAHEIQSRYGSRPMLVTPLAVDDHFRPGNRDDARSRVAERFGVRGPFVLVVGTIEPRKGLDVLFDAAGLAPADGSAPDFVLAGAVGPAGGPLADRARRLGWHVLGHVTDADLVMLYRAADLLALPSLAEGFGLTPLEAAACGTPSVLSQDATPAVAAVGAGGVAVERDPRAWCSAIEAIRRSRDTMSAAAVTAAGRHRWETTVDATRGELLRLAGQAGGPDDAG